MCKCKEENVKKVEAVDITDLVAAIICDIMDDTNQAKKAQNIDLEKEIDKVVFNDPATIVFWKDGTKTVTKCCKGDAFNKETGLAMCIIRKLCNNKHYNNVFEKYCN